MFDLEQAIADWRSQMLAAGIKTPVPLEELEIHLREEIEQSMKLGLSVRNAFQISAQQIGQPKMLNGEFKKSERTFMKIGIGIIGMLIGAALVVPGSIQLHDELVVANGKLALLLLGLGLVGWSFDMFRQIIWPEASRRKLEKVKMPLPKQILKVGAGAIVLLTGLAFMMPAAALAGQDGMMRFADLCYLIFGIALLMVGAVVTFCPYKKRAA
jgi:hypothetical protein